MTNEIKKEEKKELTPEEILANWLKIWDLKTRDEILIEGKNLSNEFLEKVIETKEKHFSSYVLWLEFRAKHEMISRNYTLADLTKSATAFAKKIDNRPTKEAIMYLNYLAKACLDDINRNFGIEKIDCAYRCPELNKAVGGVEKSQHVEGKAADIVIRKMSMERWRDMVPAVSADQMYYDVKKHFVHVSYEPQGNRQQKWVKE